MNAALWSWMIPENLSVSSARRRILPNVSMRKRNCGTSREQLRALAAYLQSVREEERTRIARELHDEIGQGLTAIKLALQRCIARKPDVAADLEQALGLANELIGRVRDLSLELRPTMLDDLGLLAACAGTSSVTPFNVKLTLISNTPVSTIADFSPEIETAAYRIVQEALTNVARHARSTKWRWKSTRIGTGYGSRSKIGEPVLIPIPCPRLGPPASPACAKEPSS